MVQDNGLVTSCFCFKCFNFVIINTIISIFFVLSCCYYWGYRALWFRTMVTTAARRLFQECSHFLVAAVHVLTTSFSDLHQRKRREPHNQFEATQRIAIMLITWGSPTAHSYCLSSQCLFVCECSLRWN